MMKQLISTTLILLLCTALAFGKKNPPNVVIIIADDCTHSDLSLFGGTNVSTPSIDKLATEGKIFNKAYVTMPMCTPSRTELYTGMYPAQTDVLWNHARAKEGTMSIVQHLDKLGYRTGIAGKLHIQPLESVFPFEMIPGVERDCVSKTAEYDAEGMKEFVTRNSKQPFCMVTALTCPHAPWTVGDPSHFDPDKLKLPPYMADTKQTRDAYAKYLAEIEVLDQQVGLTIQMLKDAGVYANTIVIFTSEQGAQFPYCKWTNYDNGVHTALIVKWDGVVEPNTRTDALVQYCDVLPTIIDIAGGDTKGFDGTSFLPVLNGETETHRKYAYFIHNNYPEGPSYPIRSITDGEFHYVWNLKHEDMYIEKHLMSGPYWPSWVSRILDGDNLGLVSGYMIRPEVELYDTKNDKYERNNLADNAKYEKEMFRLEAELKKWMSDQGGLPKEIDTKEMFEANKKENNINP